MIRICALYLPHLFLSETARFACLESIVTACSETQLSHRSSSNSADSLWYRDDFKSYQPCVPRAVSERNDWGSSLIKRSMNPGYSGVENDLFYLDYCSLIFSDAKKVCEGLVNCLKSA